MSEDQGLSLFEAARFHGSEAELKALDVYDEHKWRVHIFVAGAAPTPHEVGHEKWLKLFQPIADRLLAKLTSAQVYAVGLRRPFDPAKGAERIAPSSWRRADPDWTESTVWFGSVSFSDVEVFGLSQAPEPQVEIFDSPKTASTGSGKFAFSENYRSVTIDGQIINLGPKQVEVIRRLHKAYLSADPWVHGKQLIPEDSTATSLRDLFTSKSKKELWRKIIASDGFGKYSLNMKSQ